MPKFTIEEHEERMRKLLTQKPLAEQKPNVLQNLLDKAKLRGKPKPFEEKPPV